MGTSINLLKDRIEKLNEVLYQSSESANSHNQAVRHWTWVLAFFTAIQALAVTIPLLQPNKVDVDFRIHMQQKIFDECFDYYARSDQQTGIHVTTIQTCREKTEKYMKDIK